jgi:GT2 family glycosyltransferase
MMSQLGISVVICAYTEERWEDVMAAIESVRRQSVAPQELILVIDHNPALLNRARRLTDGVVVVDNDQVRGLGGARNSGIMAAGGAVVAFLDDDAVADSDWLAQLLTGYRHSDVLGVGGASIPSWQGEPPSWFPAEFNWVVGCAYLGLPSAVAPVRNLFGSNMSFRRSIFATLGGFRLGYGCDETEFCIRLRRQWPDKKLLYQPQARIRHKVPINRGTWRYFASRCYFEGRSKAVVSWLWGSKDGLESERAYVARTLPRGMASGIADAALRRRPGGLARAAAIALGLGSTTAGYVSGKMNIKQAARERGYVEIVPPSEAT